MSIFLIILFNQPEQHHLKPSWVVRGERTLVMNIWVRGGWNSSYNDRTQRCQAAGRCFSFLIARRLKEVLDYKSMIYRETENNNYCLKCVTSA